MPLTYLNYTGDGVTTIFNVPSLLPEENIRVIIDNIELFSPISWSFINGRTQIQLTAAPFVGQFINIFRVTDPINTYVNFENGAFLVEADLDKLTTQLLHLAQITTDYVTGVLALDNLGQITVFNKRITNVGSPINPNDAATFGVVTNLNNATLQLINDTTTPLQNNSVFRDNNGYLDFSRDYAGTFIGNGIVYGLAIEPLFTSSPITSQYFEQNAITLQGNGQWNVENRRLENTANPINNQDAVTLSRLNQDINGLDGSLRSRLGVVVRFEISCFIPPLNNAYNRSFNYTFGNHSGESAPTNWELVLRCISPEYGYSVNDEVKPLSNVSIKVNKNNVTAVPESYDILVGSAPTIQRADTFGEAPITLINWSYVVRFWD